MVDESKLALLAEDLINFVILKGGNLEKWLALRSEEVELKMRPYSELESQLWRTDEDHNVENERELALFNDEVQR
jgi:hypothetical protein